MTHRIAATTAAALVLVLDQLAKWYVTGPLDLASYGDEGLALLPVFRLVAVSNHGVSMGLLALGGAAGPLLLTALTAAIALAVAWWMWREERRIDALALGAILGGALGNIADRARLGHVVDFLNLHFGAWSPFLVFNVADVAISLGVALLVIRALFLHGGASPSEKANV